MAKDGPLKRRGTQRGRPGAHQRSVSLCTAEKAHVFDGYPWTWPRHRVGTRAEGLNGGKRKGKRRQRGEDRRRSWDTALRISASRSGISQEFLLSGFVLPLLICIWRAAHSPSLSSSVHLQAGISGHFCEVLCVQFHKHLP